MIRKYTKIVCDVCLIELWHPKQTKEDFRGQRYDLCRGCVRDGYFLTTTAVEKLNGNVVRVRREGVDEPDDVVVDMQTTGRRSVGNAGKPQEDFQGRQARDLARSAVFDHFLAAGK